MAINEFKNYVNHRIADVCIVDEYTREKFEFFNPVKYVRNKIMEEMPNDKEEYIKMFFDMVLMTTIDYKAPENIDLVNNEFNIPFKLVHVTHNDSDAIGCSILINLLNECNFTSGKVKTYFCDTNRASDIIRKDILLLDENNKSIFPESIPLEQDELTLLLITDINVTDDICKLIEDNEYIIPLMIDHHPTNKHGDLPWCLVGTETNISATGQLYNKIIKIFNDLNNNKSVDEKFSMDAYKIRSNFFKYIGDICVNNIFHSMKNKVNMTYLNKIVNDISRYDTWEWQKSPSLTKDEDETTIALKLLDRDCHYLSKVMTENLLRGDTALSSDILEYMIHKKKKTEKYIVSRELEKVVTINMGGEYGDIPFSLYNGDYGNALMQVMYEFYPDAKFVCILYPESRKLSLRTNKPDVHVGEIAKEYMYNNEGGGHASAAGCTLSPEDTIAILKDIFKKSVKGEMDE